jgi:hypothetical protein
VIHHPCCKLVEPNNASDARRNLVEIMLLCCHVLWNANSNANMSSSANAQESDDNLQELDV